MELGQKSGRANEKQKAADLCQRLLSTGVQESDVSRMYYPHSPSLGNHSEIVDTNNVTCSGPAVEVV